MICLSVSATPLQVLVKTIEVHQTREGGQAAHLVQPGRIGAEALRAGAHLIRLQCAADTSAACAIVNSAGPAALVQPVEAHLARHKHWHAGGLGTETSLRYLLQMRCAQTLCERCERWRALSAPAAWFGWRSEPAPGDFDTSFSGQQAPGQHWLTCWVLAGMSDHSACEATLCVADDALVTAARFVRAVFQ